MHEIILSCLLAVAVLLVVAGVALISTPAGLIVAGVGVAGWSWLTFGEVDE